MSTALVKLWTWDAYLAWESQQERRHELVDGQVYAMVGGSMGHDLIANNLRRELGRQLQGQPCRPHGPDMKVATGTGNARYPDALIDCGRFLPDAQTAQDPVAVFEVLSKSTAWIDQNLKLRDYDATVTIKYYALIAQDEPRVLLYTRGEDGRIDLQGAELRTELAESVHVPAAGVHLPLTALYEGMLFGTPGG
jgi:Uma2 family endonuclease